MASPLNCGGQLPLMLGAGTGHALGQNFPLFGNQLLQAIGIFIIDVLNLVHTKGTDFASASGTAEITTSVIGHRSLLSKSVYKSKGNEVSSSGAGKNPSPPSPVGIELWLLPE
jgi:hypothetical protein